MDRDDRRVLLLAAEPAAGLGLDDARADVVEGQGPLHRLVDVVRALQRAVDGQPAVLLGHGDHRVVLDVELLLVPDAVGPLEHDLRLREARFEVARGDLVVREDVVAHERVEDRRERLGARGDGRLGRPKRLSVRGRDERQRLGVVLDLAADRDQDRLVVADQRHDVVARDVGRGHEHDLRPVEALVALEPEQAGMGVARTDRRPVPRPGEDEVVGVLRGPGQLVRALAPERAAAACTTGHDRIGGDHERGRG